MPELGLKNIPANRSNVYTFEQIVKRLDLRYYNSSIAVQGDNRWKNGTKNRFKVVFENPLLVATELWHFLGYDKEIMTELLTDWLLKTEDLIFIDVTDAEEAAHGNGHAYFRKSPWVSSDILSTLMYDLSPEERGLYRTSEDPSWKFPENYIANLVDSLININPALAPLKEQQKEE